MSGIVGDNETDLNVGETEIGEELEDDDADAVGETEIGEELEDDDADAVGETAVAAVAAISMPSKRRSSSDNKLGEEGLLPEKSDTATPLPSLRCVKSRFDLILRVFSIIVYFLSYLRLYAKLKNPKMQRYYKIR